MAEKRTQLETVIQTAIDSALKELHTCLPAVVTKVSGQTIDCQPTIKRKLAGELVNLPLLTNVPIRYMKTKTFSISIPIEVDDHVLVVFSERSIDTWLTQGGLQNPFDIRKHSLSDAFAFPMMYPETDLIPDFDASNLVIKTNSGNTKIIVKSEGVEITTTGPTDITSSKTTINNDVLIDGKLDVTDTITAPEINGNGVNFTTHTHTQPNDGGGDSEQPVNAPSNP